MRQKEIQITISPTGEVSFTVAGVKGKACLEETKFLEEAMGGKVLEQTATDEMYVQEDVDTVTVGNK
jgi:hypothetical protein